MPERLSDTVYGLINDYTGEWQTFTVTATWIDGTIMDDSKCDGVIYRKQGSEYFKLNYSGPVNPIWFGADPTGTTDSTPAFQAAIDAFQTGTAIDSGVDILIPRGNYLLGDLIIKTGTKLYANQSTKDNFISNVPVTIRPFGNPDYVIDCDATASNWAIENLYIDCDYTNQPQLIAGIRTRGTKAYLLGNNINKAPGHAVYNAAGLIFIEKNSILGMFAPNFTFTGINDFKGALHMASIGDSYVFDNEISASLPYFTSTVTPRDPINGRIVAMSFGGTFSGTSVISGNLFENGDRAVAIGNSLYCNWHNNRYELSAMGGLYIYGPTQFATFSQERFADNSLSVDGGADDITIAIGAAGNIAFVAPTFESLANVDIPNSSFQVNYHISNYGSDLVDLVTPIVDPTYAVNGLVNLSGPTLLPVRQVKGQYDPDNPKFDSVSTQLLPAESPQLGYVKLKQGTDSSNGSFVGAVEFWTPEDTLAYSIGFSPKEYLSVSGYEPDPIFALNGNVAIQKEGEAKCTIWSTDSLGNSQLVLQGGALVTSQGTITLDNTTEELSIISSGDVTVGINENFRFQNNGLSLIPVTPTVSTITSSYLLGRDSTTGEMIIIDPVVIPDSGDFIQNQILAPQNAGYYISQPSKVEYINDTDGNVFGALEVYRTILNPDAKAPQSIRSVFRVASDEAGHEDKELTSVYGGLHISSTNTGNYTNPTEGLIAVAGTASHLGAGDITLMSCFGALGGNAPANTGIISRFAFYKVTSYDLNSNPGKVTSVAGFAQPKLTVPGTTGQIQWFSGMGDATTSGGMLGNQTWPTGNWNMYDASTYSNYFSGTILASTLTDDTTSKLQVGGTTRTAKVVGGTVIGDTLSLQNYTSGTTGAVLDQYGFTVGGGTASANTLYKATRAFTNPTGNVHGFRAEHSVIATGAPTTTALFGGFFVPTIGAGNNQNWTTPVSVQGISVVPTITSGATGTIAAVIAGTFDLNLRAAGATITNAMGVRIYVDPLTTSTMTHVTLLGLGTTATVNGNWSIYNDGAFACYMGTGNMYLNTTTDTGSGAKLQVNGGIESTSSRIVGSSGAQQTIVNGANTMTTTLSAGGSATLNLSASGGNFIFSKLATFTPGIRVNNTSSNIFLPEAFIPLALSNFTYLFAGVGTTDLRVGFGGDTNATITANGSYTGVMVGRSLITGAATGIHPIVAGLAVESPTIIPGSSTITTAASLYIDDVPTAGVGNYAIYARTGDMRLAAGRAIIGTANIVSGTGSPETVVTAPVGSLFLRTDGGANTTLYVKESGVGNTGWIAK